MILNSVISELRQTPVASSASAVAAIVSTISLILASRPSVNTTITEGGFSALQGSINSNNVLLIIAFFLSTVFFLGFLINILADKHYITALVISIPLISLVNFITILIIYLMPPRELSKELFINAHDLIFYASACIFLSFFARHILRIVGNLVLLDGPDSEVVDEALLPVLAFALIILFAWGGCISGGQQMLSKTFLPEIAQLPKTGLR